MWYIDSNLLQIIGINNKYEIPLCMNTIKKKKKDVSRYQPLYSAWICQTINKLQAETLTETTTLILARNKYTLPIKQHDLTGPQ